MMFIKALSSPIVRIKDEVAMEIASIKTGKGQPIAW